jgi:hypothetical protein
MAGGDNEKKLPLFRGGRPSAAGNSISYSDWRFKLESEAEVLSCWTWMDRKTTTRPDREKYAKVLALMIRSLADDGLDIAKKVPNEEKTARNLLDKLDEEFVSQATSTRLSNISRLVGGAKQPSESVAKYVTEKRRTLREDLQNRIDPKEVLVGAIVAGVGPDYDAAVNSVIHGDNLAGVDVDVLEKKLREHEKKLADRKSEVTTTASTALNVSAGASKADIDKQIGTAVDKAMAHYTHGGGGYGGGYQRPWKPNNDRRYTPYNNGGGYGGGSGGKNHGGKGKGKGKGKKGNETQKTESDGTVVRKCFNCQGWGHEAKTCPSAQKKRT